MRDYGTGNFWKSHGSLYYRIWVDGVRHQLRLGRIEDFTTQRERNDAAKEFLAKLPITSPRDVRNVTLADFVERIYLPWAKEAVRASVYAEYKGMYERHIKHTKPLRHYDTAAAQDLLDSIAEEKVMGKNTMKHVRAFLSGVFKHAKKRGLFAGENPVRDCTLPSGLRPPRSTSAYTLAQVNLVLAQLEDDPEARAIVSVAAFAGLRRSEIQGLRWCDWQDDDQLHVQQSVFKHVVNPPKSVASRSWVPIVPQLRTALESYKAYRLANDQFGLMEDRTARMFRYTLDHVGRKRIGAAFQRAGLTFAGYHGFRRGLASNLFELGCEDLLVMRVLRHASVQVTRSSYIKVRDGILESAMSRLSEAAKNQDAIRVRGAAGSAGSD
jgi:integrase